MAKLKFPTSLKMITQDSVSVLHFVFLGILEYKLIKVALNILLLFIMTLVCFQTYLFLKNFDSLYFFKFAPFYCTSLYVVLALYANPITAKFVSDSLKMYEYWTLENVPPTVKTKIEKESKFLKILLILNVITAFLCGVTYAIPNKLDEETMYFIPIFEQLSSILSKSFTLFYRGLCVFAPLFMMTPLYHIIYSAARVTPQWHLFLNFLENIEQHADTQNQKKLNQKLKFCIKRHIHLSQIFLHLLRSVKEFVFIFSIFGTVLMISLILTAIWSSFEGQFDRVLTTSIVSVLTFLLCIWTGQNFEDLTDQTSEILTNLNWYDWNEENKKIYLIFLINSQQKLKIQFSETVSVDYPLGVSIVRSIYSIVSVLYQLKESDF